MTVTEAYVMGYRGKLAQMLDDYRYPGMESAILQNRLPKAGPIPETMGNRSIDTVQPDELPWMASQRKKEVYPEFKDFEENQPKEIKLENEEL